MVARKETSLQTDTTINNGIMGKQDASGDNAQADTGGKDDPSKASQRDDNPDAQTTSAVETAAQRHKGTCPTATRRRSTEGNRVRQKCRKNRHSSTSSKTSRNARSNGAQ